MQSVLSNATKPRYVSEQPTVVNYLEHSPTGVQPIQLARYAIGFIVRGTKGIYQGDTRRTITAGEMFYMGIGQHYIENRAEPDHPFEQITFYYHPSELHSIISHLTLSYRIQIRNNHSCAQCRNESVISMPASQSLQHFFTSAHNTIDRTAENIRMTELVYLIVSGEDCCLKTKLLGNIDSARANFEQTVYSHVFRATPIEELSSLCNRSLTSFKNEFRRVFNQPPHRWYINRRLTHSRMLLCSTSKSVSEIGSECAFPNTSHYIKLFKKAYGLTPATYRQLHRGDIVSDQIVAAGNATATYE